MVKKELITCIVPCFNEEEVIPIFYKEITKVSSEMKMVDFEYLFIDDGSSDKTLKGLRDYAKKDKRVRYISFSKNYGKEAGMYAGLNNAKGDYVAIMDVDLQDPPELLKEMYKYIVEDGYDVAAIYSSSHEDYPIIRKGLTKLWYKINYKLSGNQEKPGTRDFRLMKRKVVESIISMREFNRYTRGLYSYVGYNIKWISIPTPDRVTGTSKFPLKKLISYSLEAITSTSTKPLTISAHIGLLFCLISFIFIIVIIAKTLIFGDPVSGWPSLACIITFLSGLQLFFFGILGLYVSKIYTEVKSRPLYFINETEKDIINKEED